MTTTNDHRSNPTETNRKEVIAMNLSVLYALDLARERQEQALEDAAAVRRISQPRPSSVRRSLGYRVIAVGQRIAAEPSLELARSR